MAVRARRVYGRVMPVLGRDDDADDLGSAESSWAEPSTLLGMIQRGRGACYGAAHAERAMAGDFVVDCIVHDPRWDHQVEERSWLYATLVVDLRVDLSRLRAAFAGPLDASGDTDTWLATGVFERLAHRGVGGSVTELRHYLRSGRDLEQVLGSLIPFIDHPEAEGLLDDVLEVADDEQLQSTIGWLGNLSAPPWPDWRRASARIERVAAAAAGSRSAGSRPKFDRATRSAAHRERVLRAAIESGLITAISGPELTDERWETTLLGIASDMLQSEDRRVRIAVRRCLRNLRSPRALAWARANTALDGYAGSVALSLIADIAETSDAPWLLELLVEAVARGNGYLYEQCDLVDGLARLGNVVSIATVEEIFDNTVYSRLRERCAAALSSLAADFADERAVECLDDCESETRAIAIAHANMLVPEVRERIGRIADDLTEEDTNRRAATTRIMLHR